MKTGDVILNPSGNFIAVVYDHYNEYLLVEYAQGQYVLSTPDYWTVIGEL